MPIPVYKNVRLPALKFFADGKIHRTREVDKALAPVFQLTPSEMEEILPSGTQSRWSNRVDWACYDLYRAELLQRPKRGHYQITPLGQQTLAKNPSVLTREYLEANFPVFKEWSNKPSTSSDKSATPAPAAPAADQADSQTPEERIVAAYAEFNDALACNLLERVRAMDPFRFEYLVVDLLKKMGYGGPHAEARVTQRTNDEGIDGVINKDRLGLDTIYVQAKRWQTAVGRKEVQSFVGALAGQGASKGVFITSGDFVPTATDYVKNIAQKVILIDGARLAKLMIEHDVGVSKEEPTYTLKRIDSDYFDTN